MSFNSALYDGTVVHERVRPRRHRLRYDVFTMLLDLDELPELDHRFRLFGYNRAAVFSFHDKDHGPTTGAPLKSWVEARLAEAGLQSDGGPIRLLCYPRIFGYAFNPISVYFCYHRGGALMAILYEVCNTFKERHTYIIPVDDPARPVIRQRCDKALYVSPFIGMDAIYHFRIVPPGDGVNIVIRQEDTDGLLLAASFQGNRRPFQARTLARTLVRFPFLTLKVIVGIYWEAFRLWLKGVPVFRHQPAIHAVQSSVEQHVKSGS
ncbi:MAG: DUF1365 domain-containing protein [Rhodospirillales bacterium]